MKWLKQDPKAVEDLEFMSAVDTALNDKGKHGIYIFSFVVLGVFIFFLFWAGCTKRNEVTKGQGYVIPSDGIRPVQSEGGIIKEIFVRENAMVEKGDLLATISNVQEVAEHQSLLNKKVEYELRLERLRAEQQGVDLVYPEEIIKAHPQVVDDQMELFRTRRQKYLSEGEELQALLQQRKREVIEAQHRRTQAEKTLHLLNQQETRIAPLVRSKAYAEVDYLKLRQRIVAMKSELNTLASRISSGISAVEEAEQRLKNRGPEWQSMLAKDVIETQKELKSTLELLKAGADKVQRSELRSLVRGTIKRILMKQDAVVRPADTIMEIVPTDDGLEIEAKFRPQDRGYLTLGQAAVVKVSSYESSQYGVLEGTIHYISPDTIEDSKGEPWYEVRLRTSSTTLPYKKKELKIKVGMTVTVEVISGDKSILAYLFKPLIKSRYEGKVSAINQTNSTERRQAGSAQEDSTNAVDEEVRETESTDNQTNSTERRQAGSTQEDSTNAVDEEVKGTESTEQKVSWRHAPTTRSEVYGVVATQAKVAAAKSAETAHLVEGAL